jgi:hypothetical protein
MKRLMKILVIIIILSFSIALYSDSAKFYNKVTNNLFKIPKDAPDIIYPSVPTMPTEGPIVWQLPPMPTSVNTTRPNKPTAKPGEMCI